MEAARWGGTVSVQGLEKTARVNVGCYTPVEELEAAV